MYYIHLIFHYPYEVGMMKTEGLNIFLTSQLANGSGAYSQGMRSEVVCCLFLDRNTQQLFKCSQNKFKWIFN